MFNTCIAIDNETKNVVKKSSGMGILIKTYKESWFTTINLNNDNDYYRFLC